jgi:hypothetical protein
MYFKIHLNSVLFPSKSTVTQTSIFFYSTHNAVGKWLMQDVWNKINIWYDTVYNWGETSAVNG